MLIRYVGRKTGKPYEIPVRYAERDGVFKCFTDKTAGWWPNLRDNQRVSLVIERRDKRYHASRGKSKEKLITEPPAFE